MKLFMYNVCQWTNGTLFIGGTAISLDLGDGSGDGDSMSVISTATLPQLFTTPRDSPGLTFASLTRSLDTNPLSRYWKRIQEKQLQIITQSTS